MQRFGSKRGLLLALRRRSTLTAAQGFRGAGADTVAREPLRALVTRTFPDIRQVDISECPSEAQYRIPFTSLPLAGGQILVVYGFVDYIDAFGVRHRGGYARQYVPNVQGNNNLVFLDHPSYDYDRPRRPGEGNDWN